MGISEYLYKEFENREKSLELLNSRNRKFLIYIMKKI